MISRDPKKYNPQIVMMKTNHSSVEDRSVKMVSRILPSFVCVCLLATLANGLDFRRRNLGELPTADECMRPPMSKNGHECCRLPRERIWGDLRPSFSICLRKIRDENRNMGQEMSVDTVTPNTSDVTESPNSRGGRPRGKKQLSERLKELFSSVYKEIKNTFNSIWQSVVIITDHLRRHANDSCFMECVFENQGFLIDKMITKDALIQRLNHTLKRNEAWHKVATEAVETCYQTVIPVSSNTVCQSGSEEIFRCVLKQIFFNCPRWTPTNYCISLKEFYQRCPNGPPPEMNDEHSTPATSPAPSMEPEELSEENTSSTEPETVTEQQ